MTETRADLESKLADLRLQRGYALRDGKSYPDSKITEIQTALDSLDDVAAVEIVERRQASEATRQKEVTALLVEIKDAETASLNAKKDAESNLRKAVTAERLHHMHEATKRKAQSKLQTLGGQKQPIQNQMALEDAQSRKWIALLRTITGGHSFGALKHMPSAVPDPNKSWT